MVMMNHDGGDDDGDVDKGSVMMVMMIVKLIRMHDPPHRGAIVRVLRCAVQGLPWTNTKVRW